MAKNKQTRTKVVNNHKFAGCRESLLTGGTGSSPGTQALVITTNSGGGASGSFALCPLGLTAAKLTSGAYVAGTYGNVCSPPLRGLFARAMDFQMYRVTRAKLVFVSNVGSTTVGIVTLAAYTSVVDVNIGTGVAQISGPSTRTFDLANGSTKELSVPIPVDSSWKKVSSVLSVLGTTAPFFGGGDSVVTVASADDLCFSAISYTVGFGPNVSNVGSLFIDYDVEFKGVIDASVNI